jgi:hypothetical protein
MNDEERRRFEEANKKVHPVETQWHYPTLTKHGFVPETKEQVGFVRAYTYTHPDGRRIRCNTGVNSDYWTDLDTKKFGYWRELEPHIAR